MKNAYKFFLGLTLLMTTQSALASQCHTDGCVIRKNAATAAVIEWINTNDDCENAVSWLFSMKRAGDSRFELICGDDIDKTRIVLEVEVDGFGIAKVQDVSTTSVSSKR